MKADTAIYTAFEDHQTRDTALGEKGLMQAILRSAMDDLQKRGDVHRQARFFFLSNDDQYLYSFLSICGHLGLCAKTIREKLGLTPVQM